MRPSVLQYLPNAAGLVLSRLRGGIDGGEGFDVLLLAGSQAAQRYPPAAGSESLDCSVRKPGCRLVCMLPGRSPIPDDSAPQGRAHSPHSKGGVLIVSIFSANVLVMIWRFSIATIALEQQLKEWAV